jgi:hypothetical protein
MKFLCVKCDQPMKLERSQGPDEGSLTVTFGCPQCGQRVAMLTNPFETQLIRSLGVKVGGRTEPATPFEHLRSSMRHQREAAFEGAAPAGRDEAHSPAAEAARGPAAEAGVASARGPAIDDDGPGCPFANMLASQESENPGGIGWSPEAEARVERIPSFIRPMAKKAIERYAEGKGHRTITETVMDEARGALGM